ncbi:unnamed protein product [Schistocephalus solidus]|uniref:General transcription factor IIH subunit 4 n=3 Tax=Schistocephalus solidus TaxID=70667 RepID=A0A183TF29_SCHSO|nr:unnamed protein product [Schistocephalus solidus]
MYLVWLVVLRKAWCLLPSVIYMATADDCKSLFDYLKTIETSELDALYEHPPACLIVFRELSELAKHLVLRLLFLEQTIPKAIVSGWVAKGSHEVFQQACKDLSDLRIWHSIDSNTSRGSWRLNKKFQDSMRISLFGGGQRLLSDLGSETAEKHPKDVEFLDNYATERWDVNFAFLIYEPVNLTLYDSGEVGICIRKVLLLSGLMKRGGSDSSIGITQRGFQFLLMDKPSQVLRFILHYFNYLREEGLNLVESLQFVFQLSFLSVGKSYPTEVLSDAQQNLLQHMRELGLAYQRKRTAPRFYVTRLALSLSFGSSSSGRTSKALSNISGGLFVAPSAASTADSDPMNFLPTGVSAPGLRAAKSLSLSTTSPAYPPPAAVAEVGYILVETNFRLYAYTDSPLRTALLSLFSKIRARYPNLVVADITRDSVREALLRGISANQIISFLTTNAHPDMLRQPSILPPTLIDQVRLWELERERLFAQEGCLYEQFAKNKDFEMVRDFAKGQGFLLWECPDRRLMVVSKTGHEDVRKFWRQNRP